MAKKPSDAKTTLRRLLDAIGVKRVVYVDDVFSASAERVQETCDGLSIDELQTSDVFGQVDFGVDDEEVLREQIRNAIGEMDKQTVLDTFIKLASIAGDGIALPDAEVVPRFAGFFEKGVDLVTLSREQYLIQKTDLIAGSSPEETLFIFDEDFRHEGAGENEGRRLVSELHAELQQGRTSFALLTHTVPSDFEQETARQAEIASEFEGLADTLVVIAKERLTAEHQGFGWRMKSAILARMFGTLKAKLQESVEVARKAAEETLEQLHVEEFERIIFHSSQIEGAWAPETLVRVFGDHYERGARNHLRADGTVHELAEQARQVCMVPTEGVSNATRDRAIRFQRVEVYEDAEDINSLLFPLELGDVFETEDGNRFVVLGQPCDLMVRADRGFRRGASFDNRQFVVLATINGNDKVQFNAQAWQYKLPHYGGPKVNSFVDLNATYWIPAWILDLASLNTDGTAQLSHDHAQSPLLIPAWRLRLKKLIGRVQAAVDRYKALVIANANEDQSAFQSLLGLPPECPFSVELSATDSEWQVSCGIRRVMRIREPFASALYVQFGNWSTRPAFPHDLTRIE